MASGVEFLNELYENIGQWAGRQEMVEAVTLLPQQVRRWALVAGKHPGQCAMPFSLDLQRGAIFAKDGLIFGVSIGEGFRGYYERGIRSTRLQFGGYKWGLNDMKHELDLNFFAGMVNKKGWGSWMYGEVYEYAGRVEVDCWTDEYKFGGVGISQGMWPQDQLLSASGKAAIVGMVARTVERS